MKFVFRLVAAGFVLGPMAVSWCSFGQGTPPPVPSLGAKHQPRIEFSEMSYHFGKVKPTDTLKYDFIVTNSGDAVLQITAVQPGCGCTTAGAWDPQVPPGKTGKIPIQLNPASFSGLVSKGITVTCNDPARPTCYLQIQAIVWRPIDLQPQYIYFLPVEDDFTNETKLVQIINNAEEAITLQPPQSSTPVFKTELKIVKAGREFELLVTYSGPVSNANPQGNITINTSLPGMSWLSVPVVVMPQPALVSIPQSIQLPSGPLPAEHRSTASIRNNTHGAVKLYDASVNREGVKVQMYETDPGKNYSFNVDFPAGFQAGSGVPLELSVKTSHPKHSLIKIPILPAAPAPTLPAPVTPGGGTK